VNGHHPGEGFFICARVAKYQHVSGHDLPSVLDDMRRMDGLMEGFGYKCVLERLDNPTEDDFKRTLTSWFAHKTRTESDAVALLFGARDLRQRTGIICCLAISS
jgi:hypothetical protein